MLVLALLWMVSSSSAPAAPAQTEPAVWKVRLEVAGVNRLFRDAPPPAIDVGPGPEEGKRIFLSLARQWRGRWTIEGHGGYLWEGPLIRERFGVRGGRYLTLLDTRSDVGRGSVMLLVPLVGVAYRGRGYNWVHGPADTGQLSIALTSALALDYTYFWSSRWGWTLRARLDGALAVHQAGPPFTADYDSSSLADGYRGHVGVAIDTGLAF